MPFVSRFVFHRISQSVSNGRPIPVAGAVLSLHVQAPSFSVEAIARTVRDQQDVQSGVNVCSLLVYTDELVLEMSFLFLSLFV